MKRTLLVGLGLALGIGATSAWAQGTVTDYAVEQFGPAPMVPDAPLAPDLAAAVKVAFVDSVEQSRWDEDQVAALDLRPTAIAPRYQRTQL